MKLYNTLTRTTDDIKPLDDQNLRIYTCGPTVYDHAHIGNLSSYIFADTLRRTAAAAGLQPKQIMNYTDVDDKTIRRSRERFPELDPQAGLRKLTDDYIDKFMADMRLVGNDVEAIQFIRATDSIEGMKDLIMQLYAKGFAYVADDGVYFSIEAYRKAGKTYGQLLELTTQNTSAARIQNDEYDKDSVHDFALWKTQKPGEPVWHFQLDGHDVSGRPGWHIECSVMSRAGLGQPFDIHTGGIDLVFPHHENEIAQSTALTDNPLMAACFTHNNHILVDGKKMAKSANNFYTLQDITDKGYEPLAFRLMVLQAHYRNQVNFTWESLDAAQNRLQDIYAWADLRHQPNTDIMPEELDLLFKSTRETMQAAIEDDLNTPLALAALSKLMNYMAAIPIPGVEGKYTNGTLELLETVFGLPLCNRTDITEMQKDLIRQREQARNSKAWTESDTLRDQLANQGIGLRDMPFGTQWFRR